MCATGLVEVSTLAGGLRDVQGQQEEEGGGACSESEREQWKCVERATSNTINDSRKNYR